METFIIRFPSVTYAQKAQGILERNGYRSRLTRASAKGCAFGLEIRSTEKEKITALLTKNDVAFLP